MPTTLPARAAPSYDRASETSLTFLVSMALILVLAATFSIMISDRFGLLYATDGQCLVAYPSDGQLYFP